ncbi:unnamed protein product [Urochloa humidicola]
MEANRIFVSYFSSSPHFITHRLLVTRAPREGKRESLELVDGIFFGLLLAHLERSGLGCQSHTYTTRDLEV